MFPFKSRIWLPDEAGVKAGDIVGFAGYSWQSAGVNIATYGIPWWSISHVGIMATSPDGILRLFESTTLDGDYPCEIKGKPIAGTQAHSLDATLRRYRGAVWHYPLYRPLYPQEDHRLTQFLMDTLGLPYDMIGAFRSAGVGLSWVESLFRDENLTSIFCSEWTVAAYTLVGLYATDNASRWNPARMLRRFRRLKILRKPRRLK